MLRLTITYSLTLVAVVAAAVAYDPPACDDLCKEYEVMEQQCLDRRGLEGFVNAGNFEEAMYVLYVCQDFTLSCTNACDNAYEFCSRQCVQDSSSNCRATCHEEVFRESKPELPQ